MLEILLSLGLVPLVMLVGFSPTWLATLYWLLTKFKKIITIALDLAPFM